MECVGPAWQSIPQDEDLLCAQVRFDFKANSVNFLNIRLLFISIESPKAGWVFYHPFIYFSTSNLTYCGFWQSATSFRSESVTCISV